MSALCFTARSNNLGFENPFPDGLESESFNVYVLARAYDRSGAYAEAFRTVTVSSTLNRNLKTKMVTKDLWKSPTIKSLSYFEMLYKVSYLNITVFVYI